jgi:tetratricopeptide (TPR) repeat protein
VRWKLVAVTALLAASAAARAGPDKPVDRERLKKCATLPTVGPPGWYFTMGTNGLTYVGGEEPDAADPALLRDALKGDDSDADRWMDLAAAYRRTKDAAREKDAVAAAVAILRRQATALGDDGRVQAALGLALYASGDEDGADHAIRDAKRASQTAWAGDAAETDLRLLRAAAKPAGRRFASLDDAFAWISEDAAGVAALDAAVLDGASKGYDDAVAAVFTSGATGTAAASVCMRRSSLHALLAARAAKAGAAAQFEHERRFCEEDQRRAQELLPADPIAVTLTGLSDAMSAPPDTDGARHVQAFDSLPEKARAQVVAGEARLGTLSASADAAVAGRAFQGIATLRWFVHHDGVGTDAALRASIAKDPHARGAWNALVFLLASSERWDDVVTLCDAWTKAGDSALTRMTRAKALAMKGLFSHAEKEWRAALALDPKGCKANLGLAMFVLQRAEGDAELKEAADLLRTASETLPAAATQDPSVEVLWSLADAIRRGLAGDVDGAEKSARSLVERFGEIPAAREVLAALGR